MAEMMPRYLVSFTDKRDKRLFEYVVSMKELPEDLPKSTAAGSTSRMSMETFIWQSMLKLHPYVRFSQMEIKQLMEPLQFEALELRTATEHYHG